MVRATGLTAILGSFLSALNPGGCGVGQDTAAVPAGYGTSADGGAASSGGVGDVDDAGALSGVDCGALGTHYFCDDFSGTELHAQFDENDDVSGGTIALGNAQYASAPQALAASTVHITTGTQTRAWLQKRFGSTASGKRFVLAFSEWVDPSCLGPMDLVQTGSIELIPAGTGHLYHVAMAHAADSDAILEVQTSGEINIQSHKLAQQLPHGTWNRIVLDLDLGTNTVGLAVNGKAMVEREPLESAPSGPQVPGIKVGAEVDNISFNPGACKTAIDDVTFDVVP